MTTPISCPSCSKKLFWTKEFPFKPFCCERCKLIDLGDWASEKHAIAGEPAFLTDEQQFSEE
ncbi:MAG: DNA gyrase inhibitor YacG [Cycloclasticus sp.]